MELYKFGLFGAGSRKMAVLAEFLQVYTIQFFNKYTSNLANNYIV